MKFVAALLLGISYFPMRVDAHSDKIRVTVPTKIPSVVRLVVGDVLTNSCTGFVVEKNIIVTAAHCLERSGNVRALFEDGTNRKFISLAAGNRFISASEDIAVLQGNTGNIVPIKLATEPRIDAHCRSIGYGPDYNQKQTQCYGGKEMWTEGTLVFSGDIDYGDSGGPVINDNDEIIGEQVLLSADGRPTFWAVPTSVIIKYLENLKLWPIKQ